MTTEDKNPLQDPAALANERLIRALSPHQTLRSFERGTYLFAENTWPTGVYILLAGSVEMVFGKPNKPIRMEIAGTILGLNSMISERTHEYSAEALGGVIVGYVPKEKFFAILDESRGLWMDVLKVMSRDVGSCYERVREMVERGSRAGAALH